MREVRPFVDERFGGFCFSCGAFPATRDHVPAKVFLDDPFPENLPVVGACRSCNGNASADEEYLACLLEVAACGSTVEVERPKIRRVFERRPALAARLELARTSDGYVAVEYERVRRVLAKLGRGLWSYEVGETGGISDTDVRFDPIVHLSRDRLVEFLKTGTPRLFPEVGSRLMIRTIESLAESRFDPWRVVQPNRFAYAVDLDHGAGPTVKMILRDTLAAEVHLTTPG